MPDPQIPARLHCTWVPHRHGTPAEPLVRTWLAPLLACAPADIRLRRDDHGRPRLLGPAADADVSWSHSGEGLLVALGEGVDVGIDLERTRPRPRALELARRFFHPDESAWLQALPPPAREAAFLRLWCAKEAVLKAHGRGLAFGLHRFALSEVDGRLVLAAGPTDLGGPWQLCEWAPQPGYRAALAWRPRAT